MQRLLMWILYAIAIGVLAACATTPATPESKKLKVDITIGANCLIDVEPKHSRCETRGITSVCGLPGDSIQWSLTSKSLKGADFSIEIADESVCSDKAKRNCKLKNGLPPGDVKYDIVGGGTAAACRLDPYIIVLR